MAGRRSKVRTALALTGMLLAVAGGVLPAHAAGALTLNNLSYLGTQGRIRVRPVAQYSTGATVLQTGVPGDAATNPNRTIGDDVIPLTFDTGGIRILGNNSAALNSSAADGHSHYHAGDTNLLVNDVTAFALGDTILIGSPYCNFAFRALNCANEQPLGQLAHIVGGDIGQFGPGVITISPGLTGNPSCFTNAYGSCAVPEGLRITKLPTAYPGQQMRIDIPHSDLLYNGPLPNDVAVTADFIPPQGSNDPSYPSRPLALNRENPTVFSAIVDNACPCGAGFFSFYIPHEITGTQTIGNTFNATLGDTWYTVVVRARDVVTNQVRADGVIRFKLNQVWITQLSPDQDPVSPTEAVNIRGRLRDNSSAAALNKIPVEDVIVDVIVTRPGGVRSAYQTTSCTDTNASPSVDSCGSDPFGTNPNGHGTFQVKVGGLQGLNLQIPGLTLNCTGKVILTQPNTYPAVLNVPGCALAPFLSATDTLFPGTYDVEAFLRGYSPPVVRSTTYDVSVL